MTMLTLPIGTLATYIEEYNKSKLENNKEVSIDKLQIDVPTPTGTTKVRQFIKKTNLPLLMITLSNGYSFKAATKHIVQVNGVDTFLKDLVVGSVIDHKDSNDIYVTNIAESGNEDCYDIAIDSPHIYYDSDGVVHHNTITTATLSKICEKYGRTITIVPNKSLVEQTEEDFVNCKLDVGVYYGDRKDLNKTHTICTWQSLNILDKKSHNDDELLSLAEFLDGVSTAIVDECFDGNSKILTPSGYIPIKNINIGDTVINYSEETNEFKIDKVVNQHKNLTNSTSEKMYKLEFDNGVIIKVTGNHKFLTTDGWIRADLLTDNHEVINKT